MVARLHDIVAGTIEAAQVDLNYYSHELREFVRFRRIGSRLSSTEPTRMQVMNFGITLTLRPWKNIRSGRDRAFCIIQM